MSESIQAGGMLNMTPIPTKTENGTIPMWDDCPIYRLTGGPFDGLLRELDPKANAIAFGCQTGKPPDVYALEDGVLRYQEPKP